MAEKREYDVYNLEIHPSANITFPSSFTITEDLKSRDSLDSPTNPSKFQQMQQQTPPPKNPKKDTNTNIVKLSLNFKTPIRDYTSTVTLRNNDNTDLRSYDLAITILPKVFKATMEMKTNSRIPIEQNIPVINSLEKEAKIKIIFTIVKGDPGVFTCPLNLSIKPHTTAMLPIKFSPTWIGQYSAKVTLSNPVSNEAFEYDINGIALEPLAENHMKLKLAVDEEKKINLNVRNLSEKVANIKVKFELHGAYGEDTFTIPTAYGTDTYQLCIKPTLGGVYAGCVTFTDEEGRYSWYTFEMESHGTKHIKQMDLVCYVRKSQIYEIDLVNPLNEETHYEVTRYGDYLDGDEVIVIEPYSTYKYELEYSPLKVSSTKGIINFTNLRLGEICYELTMNAEESPPVKLPLMRAELGKYATRIITLENPSYRPVLVKYEISKPDNFDISQDKIEIQPQSSYDVLLRYTPSEIDYQDACEIVFETNEIGNWKFLLFGAGDPPTPYDELVMMGSLYKEDSGIINFTNPFKANITIMISIKKDDHSHDVIDIIQKKPKAPVAAGQSCQIPFTFYPREIRDYTASIIVELNDKISWVYPIKVITESRTVNINFSFQTKSRKRLEKDIELMLPGLADIDPSEKYQAEINPLHTGTTNIETISQ